MGTIKSVLDKFSKVNLSIQVPNLIEKTAFEIEALNKEQLYRGEDSEGYQLHPTYKNKYYARKKRQMNPKPGHGIPDLFYTGSFYKYFGVIVDKSQGTFRIDSTDSKTESLKKKYGEKIFGLQPKSKAIYKEFLQKELKEYIESVTGIKLK